MYAVTSASRCTHKIVDKLTESYDVRETIVTDRSGMNVFHIALQNEDCDLELAQVLVRKYTREHDTYSIMNRRTKESRREESQGTRPLHYAITRGDMELVDMLVSVGAIGFGDEERNKNLDVQQFNRQRTRLMLQGGHPKNHSSM